MKDNYSVVQALAQWFDKQLTTMPDEPRGIAEAYLPEWSELSAAEREKRALEIDKKRDKKIENKLASATKENDRRKRDPVKVKEDSLLFAAFAAINDIEREIREIELMPASIPSELELNKQQLADARQRHDEARQRLDELQNDLQRQRWHVLANMPSLSVQHWVELTKVGVGEANSCWEVKLGGVYPVNHSENDIASLRDEINSQCALLEYQQRQPLLFPCEPIQLLQFVDNDIMGFFKVPGDFRSAVDAFERKLLGATAKVVTDTRKKWEIDGRLERTARQLGEEWMNKQKPKPGVDAIAKYLEGALKRLNMTGPRGDYWDWQTIKKEALTGITGRKANGKK